jgi:hypothetical protein
MWIRSQESQNGAKDKNFACRGALKILAALKHFRPKNLFCWSEFFSYIFRTTIPTNKGSKRTLFARGIVTKSVADPDSIRSVDLVPRGKNDPQK